MVATPFFSAIVAALSAAGVVEASSTGAAICTVGAEGPGWTAGPHVDNGQGTLSGRYQVKLATSGDNNAVGIVLGDDNDKGVNVTAGTDYSVTVSVMNDTTVFKGFLVTLQQDGKDLSGSFTLSGDSNVQIMKSEGEGAFGNPVGTCPGDVAGACHTGETRNTTDKTSVDFVMNIASTVANGPIDLTVTIMEQKVMWYFSTYGLNLLGGGAPSPSSTQAPTPSGTDAPTAANVTMTPTTAPSGAPGAGGIVSSLAAAASLTLTWLFV